MAAFFIATYPVAVDRRNFVYALAALGLGACDRTGSAYLRERSKPTVPASVYSTPIATSVPAPAQPSPASGSAPSPASTEPGLRRPPGPSDQPIGFPIDPSLRLGEVTGPDGNRRISWGSGPEAERYSREDQPAGDPVRANRCGWNARTHVLYEGQPAVDWYCPVGTPVMATMAGTATLLVVSASNPFDFYNVHREPYLGYPDGTRAPINPFPGVNGGQGVFVRVANPSFETTSAHLDLHATVAAVPDGAFGEGFSRTFDFAQRFAPMRDFRTATAIASWTVQRGDLVGISGDTGYSEAPHLHYSIKRTGASGLLCPTMEPGFSDAGWLMK